MTFKDAVKQAVEAVAGLSPFEREELRKDPGTVLAVAAFLHHVGNVAPDVASGVASKRRRFRDEDGDTWLENEHGKFDCFTSSGAPSSFPGLDGWSLDRLRSNYPDLEEIL